MRDNKQNISFYVKVNYKNEEHELLVSFSSTVKELKKIIITYFKLNQSLYEIYYKNIKLNNNDTRVLSLFFEKDNKPLLYIMDKKSENLIKASKKTSLTLFANMSDVKLNNIIKNFFEYKKLVNDADIRHNIKGMYIINFSKPSLCTDFQEFYDNYLRLENEEIKNNNSPKFKTANAARSNKLILPKIYNNNYYFRNENEKNFTNCNYDKVNDRKKAINKVILNNSKSDSISEKCIRSGKYRMHNSGKKIAKKNFSMRNKFNNYKGFYKSPYMNIEEKYYRDKFLDKKKWINKVGFVSSVNRNNSEHFIPNYVTATPSESPLLFKFRDVSKDKWINPKGFH